VSGATKGVVVEFDFTAMNGADILFDVAKAHLHALDGIELDQTSEFRYLAGRTCEEGLAAFFKTVKTKKTPQKAARDILDAFAGAVSSALPKAMTQGVRNFIKTLADRGVKVVILTHAVPEDAAVALAPILGGNVSMFQDSSTCYGFPRWDSWRRACQANGVARLSAVAVTGSGYGVRSAMLAGMSSMAVVKERTAYQDFTGADEVVKDLSVASARRVIARLFR